MADQKLTITPEVLARLTNLKSRFTFGPSDDGMYTGVFDPGHRAACDEAFAGLIDVLIRDLPAKPFKSIVLKQFCRTWKDTPASDTEDREQAILYFEQTMDALGIESSDGLLNRLLYGPILGRLIGFRKS